MVHNQQLILLKVYGVTAISLGLLVVAGGYSSSNSLALPHRAVTAWQAGSASHSRPGVFWGLFCTARGTMYDCNVLLVVTVARAVVGFCKFGPSTSLAQAALALAGAIMCTHQQCTLGSYSSLAHHVVFGGRDYWLATSKSSNRTAQQPSLTGGLTQSAAVRLLFQGSSSFCALITT